MNRFTPTHSLHLTRRRVAMAAIFSASALCLGTAALAQQMLTVRSFPAKAERGTMQITQPPELLINDKPERLSPGSRIHSVDNMLVMSGALVGQKLVVNFVREPLGLVHEVWILNAAEAAIEPVQAVQSAPAP